MKVEIGIAPTATSKLDQPIRSIDTVRKLREALKSNLEFHDDISSHLTHDVHAFPAKFPPQLPRFFIDSLTLSGEVVLDPMVGSGTTVLEAASAERQAFGFDIDPLAVLISEVKTTPFDVQQITSRAKDILCSAETRLSERKSEIRAQLFSEFDDETRAFLDYWFDGDTQLELMALRTEIDKISNSRLRRFFQLTLSAIIITKSGGVSLAWDLAHTRPHKLKQGVAKSPRPALPDFAKRVARNLASLSELDLQPNLTRIKLGSAEALPLADSSVDLIFTSPPYASNAIDYMRASKFALVWLGRSISELKLLRNQCIGGESIRDFQMEELPNRTVELIQQISIRNNKRASALKRYYSEMTRVLRESYRVLRPDRSAVFVVGSAMMGGIDSAAEKCLSQIAQSVGFDLIDIGIRRLDRNRRMMPVTRAKRDESQIENRMHHEFVLGFYKPLTSPTSHA